MPKKKTTAQDDRQKILHKELTALIKKIDEEGLIFLIKQAQTILHNAEVDRINQQLVQLSASRKQQLSGGAAAKRKETTACSAGIYIEEPEHGNHFILVAAAQRKFLTREELRSVVKIAAAAGNKGEGGRNIFNWLKRNRTDILTDMGVASASSSLLQAIYLYLKKTYRAGK